MYYDTRRHSKGGVGKGACAWEGDGRQKKDASDIDSDGVGHSMI